MLVVVVVLDGCVVDCCVVVPSLRSRGGSSAAASVEIPSRISITIRSRRAAISGGELGVHGALKDMAEALSSAALVAMLGVVTASDLRTRLIPDWALLAGVAM